MNRFTRWLLALLQGRCTHPPESVVADLLEGDGGMDAVQVQWCRICGAHQFVYTARPAGGIGGMVAQFAGAGGLLGGLLGQRRGVKTQVPTHPLQAVGGCNKACYGAASCVVGWADGSCGGRPQGTARPPAALQDAANLTFPIQTGWRLPEPRWEDGGRSMRRDARADEEATA